MTTEQTTIIQVVMPILVFLCAGLSYSLLGYWSRLKSYLRGDPAAKLDWHKIGRSAALGLVLGAAAYFAESSVTGNGVGDLTTIHEFTQQVIMTQGAIYAIDRLVLSGRGGTKSSAGITGPPPHHAPAGVVVSPSGYAGEIAWQPTADIDDTIDDTSEPQLSGPPPGKQGGT